MQEDFPRIDLSDKKELDGVLDQIKRHASTLVKEELKRSGVAKDPKAKKACDEAISGWIKSARQRLEPNITINGLPFKQGSSGGEPLDVELSQRVQRLSERADTLTAEAIAARKTIPARRVALVQARWEALNEADRRREEKRRRDEEDFDRVTTTAAAEPSSRDALKLERSEEVERTLRTSVEDIDRLALSLLEQTSAAKEQANFVKRIRLMSASYN